MKNNSQTQNNAKTIGYPARMPKKLARIIENPEKVALFEIINHRLWVHFADKPCRHFKTTMTLVKGSLKHPLFFDAHQSFSINLNYVRGTKMSGKSMIVTFIGLGITAYVSGKERQQEFIRNLKKVRIKRRFAARISRLRPFLGHKIEHV